MMEEASGGPTEQAKQSFDRDYLLFLTKESSDVNFYLPADMVPFNEGDQFHRRPDPSVITWSAKAVLKEDSLWRAEGDSDHRYLVVATDWADIGAIALESKESYLPPPTVWYYDELLKSAIQKAVRRRKSWTGYQLMRQSMQKFLRRLPVILMEDSICHPKFLFLIWLMIANSKGWELTRGQIIDTLQLLYEVAECEYHDVLPDCAGMENIPNPLITAYKERLEPDRMGMMAAMLLRSTYGGRGWDVLFLKAFALCWMERWKTHPKEWDEAIEKCYRGKFKEGTEVRTYFYHVDEGGGSDIATLKEKDKLAVGVDFHCYPKIIDTLLSIESVAHLSKEEIEKAIWYHRSGVYEKIFICERETSHIPDLAKRDLKDSKVEQGKARTRDVWEQIKGYLDEIVSTGYYWKGRLTPPTTTTTTESEEKKEARTLKKRKREEREKEKEKEKEEEKRSAEVLRHFLETPHTATQPSTTPKRTKKRAVTRRIDSYFVNNKKKPEQQQQQKQEEEQNKEEEEKKDVITIE